MDNIRGNAKQIEYEIFAKCEVCGKVWSVAKVHENLVTQTITEEVFTPTPICSCTP